MVPNLPRKILGIALLSLLALWSFWQFEIHLGLDLSGGSRIVYAIDFDKAEDEGQLGVNENRADVLAQTAEVFRRRIDPTGTKDIPVYTQGSNQIVVELPDYTKEQVEETKRLIITQGSLQFRILLNDTDNLGFAAEVQKFKDWRTAHPDDAVVDFNRVTEAEGGPRPEVRWFPVKEGAQLGLEAGLIGLDGVPVRIESQIRGTSVDDPSNWDFTGAGLARTYPANDQSGRPAVGFEFIAERKTQFARFTDEFTDRSMAIILSNEIQSAPNIEGRLPGGGQITGGMDGFSPDEVKELITVLRTGSLKVIPQLQSESYVGPTLGADSISTGKWSAGIGLAAVFVFMLAYYWINGVVAVLTLAFNAFLLMGALYFTQATLTLPGLAGLVLTIGMAVDANILIFERVREERKRGREVMQSYKNGYENAFSTIVDANLTTLITALILFYVGTGPVAGFAATLSLGILTSMFSALIFSKVVMHWAVFEKKQIKEVRMAKALAGERHIGFTGMRKVAGSISAALVVGGLAYFVVVSDDMLGIDFAGGSSAEVHLTEATEIQDMRGLLPGASIVKTGRTDEGGGTISKTFLVKRKLTPEQREAFKNGDSSTNDLQSTFADWIRGQLGPKLEEFGGSSTVSPRVSGEIRDKAVQAILLAMIAIVIYMNFRFKEYRYGLAAVVAVFHDVSITLGALALVHSIGIVQVEINLEIIAAFLTIIGYSLNDTIVVFDRVRENLRYRKEGFQSIIDLSINQSLSRTILTSVTTFFVVLVMFMANRPFHNVLEGFSFAMLIGVVVGTYSSMFVASPMLLYLDRWARHKMVAGAKVQDSASQPA